MVVVSSFSLHVWSIFKMLRQDIKANNKTSLYKKPSYCNFFRELYARYFPKEDDSV